jgi:pimeloyl-ACP methyl ester carboxylesterase
MAGDPSSYIPHLRTDQRHLTIAPSGVGYAPKPTVITLCGALEDGLDNPAFNVIGETLAASTGAVHASIELPGHGTDPAGDGLTDWARRVAAGNDLIGEFLIELRSLIDALIRLQCTAPTQIALVGISRGAFLALHAAAAQLPIAHVIACAPVVALGALSEFAALQTHPYVLESRVAISGAVGLAHRSLYMVAGHIDPRVNTEETIAFWRAMTVVSPCDDFCLRLVPSHDHQLVDTQQRYAEAAQWLIEQWQDAETP